MNFTVQGYVASGTSGVYARYLYHPGNHRTIMDLPVIRQELRKKRRSLSYQAQVVANEKLSVRLTNHSWFKNAQRIAFYLPNDGEIDATIPMELASTSGKDCYLPVLHPLKFNRLYFVKHTPGSSLFDNHYGIAEPELKTRSIVPPWSLQLILMPLVGFDRRGTRMGMGGGYYDRTLAFKKNSPHFGPKLLGLAHSLQEVDNIPRQPWDIPLNGIVTDQEFITP